MANERLADMGQSPEDRAEIEGLMAHIRRLERLAVRLNGQVRDAEAKQARRIARLEAENAELKATLAAIEQSTSWRVTAPLRWLRQRIG